MPRKKRKGNRKSGTSSTSDIDSDDEIENNSINFDVPEMPIVSNEGYYWFGKDYSNPYVADVADAANFYTGTLNIS